MPGSMMCTGVRSSWVRKPSSKKIAFQTWRRAAMPAAAHILRRMKYALALFASTLCLTVGCRTVSLPRPPEGMVSCARITDRDARLSCYDGQMVAMGVPAPGVALVAASPTAAASVSTPAPSLTPTPAPPPPAAPAPPPAAASFGADSLPPSSKPELPQADNVLLSSITSIKEVRTKLFIIALANGQVWMQEGTTITRFFRAGDEARIERSVLGNYRFSTPRTGEKNWVTVTRVQ
jgi:hypothetical protein